MIDMAALHAFTVELHSGFLTLAIIGIVLTALAQIAISFRESVPRLAGAAYKTRGYLEAAGFVAAIAGVVALIISAITGLGAWSPDALADSMITRNKIVLSSLALVAWIWVVAIRFKLGRSLWTCPWSTAAYTILALVAMSFTGMTGSLGAHLTQGGSWLDPFWDFIGFNPANVDLLLSLQVATIIAIISLFVILALLLISRLSRVGKEQLHVKICRHWPNWDEPTIPPLVEKE